MIEPTDEDIRKAGEEMRLYLGNPAIIRELALKDGYQTAEFAFAHARTIAKLRIAVEALEPLIEQCHDTERELTEDYYQVTYTGESLPLVKARKALHQIKGQSND